MSWILNMFKFTLFFLFGLKKIFLFREKIKRLYQDIKLYHLAFVLLYLITNDHTVRLTPMSGCHIDSCQFLWSLSLFVVLVSLCCVTVCGIWIQSNLSFPVGPTGKYQQLLAACYQHRVLKKTQERCNCVHGSTGTCEDVVTAEAGVSVLFSDTN